MRDYKIVFFGRENCPFCEPYKKVLKTHFPYEIDDYKVCNNYSETVPRLTALNLGGDVIDNLNGFANPSTLKNFFKKLRNTS